ncbi:MAG TPA: hypothetical protein PKZ16_00730 [bacterium]|nr:hypothetical protein [bacterium]HPL95411.1 hypothetical protein [bacterium]
MKFFSFKREIKTKLIIINTLLILIFEFCFPHQLVLAAEQNIDHNGPRVLIWQKSSMEKNKDEARQPKMVRYITVTAYSSTVDQCDDSPFITANGKRVYDGLVAANFLKFGTEVKFPDYFGDKVFTVNDRMNKKHSDRIDIWMPTREQAIQFGARYIKVEIY